MNIPPVWTEQQLETDLRRAVTDFRHARLQEPLEAYLEHFDDYQSVVEDVLEQTVDLLQIQENAISIVTDPKRLEVLRYLAGPPHIE